MVKKSDQNLVKTKTHDGFAKVLKKLAKTDDDLRLSDTSIFDRDRSEAKERGSDTLWDEKI